MTFCSSSKVAVFSPLTIDVYLCLNMSEDLNQIYCRRSLDMNANSGVSKVNEWWENEEWRFLVKYWMWVIVGIFIVSWSFKWGGIDLSFLFGWEFENFFTYQIITSLIPSSPSLYFTKWWKVPPEGSFIWSFSSKKDSRIASSSVKEEMVLSYERVLKHFTMKSFIIEETLYLKCQSLLV